MNFQQSELKLLSSQLHARDKHEVDLRREIKKLQRIRDFMRNLAANPDVKDKSRALESRKRIEVVTLALFDLSLGDGALQRAGEGFQEETIQ